MIIFIFSEYFHDHYQIYSCLLSVLMIKFMIFISINEYVHDNYQY
jgi:hypothetical protein